jgi:hypothetical protein
MVDTKPKHVVLYQNHGETGWRIAPQKFDTKEEAEKQAAQLRRDKIGRKTQVR